MAKKPIEVGEVSDKGNPDIEQCEPYTVTVTIKGVADILFHRWNCEAVAEKAKAAKGSAAKKSDNIESFIYRNDNNELCIPGEYVRQAIIGAAKFKQDPRSPRKSAVDLVKAAVVSLTPLASLGVKDYDYEDKRRVQVMRAGITRTRPAMKSGWKVTMDFMINLPEYVSKDFFHSLLSEAGRLIGIGDFRPTYGRFGIVKFDI